MEDAVNSKLLVFDILALISMRDPWYIPVVPTGKPDFGAPSCPVRALRYHYSYMTEHPELRKGRCRLFIPIKDNNAGKCSLYFSLDLHHYSGFSCHPSEQQECPRKGQSSWGQP